MLKIIGSERIALREAPDKGSAMILALVPGQQVQKLERKTTTSDHFVKVTTEAGVTGWCVERYTQEV